MAKRERSMETDRMRRTRTGGAHGDAQAGDEGLDDASISGSMRDDMSATPRHGDQLDAERSAAGDTNEDGTAGNRMESQRARRTQGRANDERWDEARGFTGKGNQREGADRPEGTGYTDDSNTAGSSSENPLA